MAQEENIQDYIGVSEDGGEETGGQKYNGESGKQSFSEEADFKKQTDVRSSGAYGGCEEPTNGGEETGSQKNNGESGKESFSGETDFKKQTDVHSLGAYGGCEEPTNGESGGEGINCELRYKAEPLADGVTELPIGPVAVPARDDSTACGDPKDVLASSAENPQLPLRDSPHMEPNTTQQLPNPSCQANEGPSQNTSSLPNENEQGEQTGSIMKNIQDLDVKKSHIELHEQKTEISTSSTQIAPHKVTPALPGVNNTSTSQNYLVIEAIEQLHKLNSICGGDWRNLALLMPTADKKEMLGLDVGKAKQKVISYIVQDMIKRIHSFDVTVNDLIDRIQRIVSKEVHWACLIDSLRQAETLKPDDLTKLLEIVGVFETLRALLSMPRHTLEDIGRNENEVRFPDMNELLKQLDNKIRKQDENDNLPPEDREKNKLCALLMQEFEPLLEIALSVGGKGLKQNLKQLSTMQVDKERFSKYLTSKGMEMIESKEMLDRPHSKCLYETHYVENCKMVGMPINRHKRGSGTLGFPVGRKGSNSAHAITSGHVMLIGELAELATNSSHSIEIKQFKLCYFKNCLLHCYQSGIKTGFVVYGHYETGNREKTGVEIVVLKMLKETKQKHVTEHYQQNKDLQNLLIFNWVFLELPRTLQFDGQFIPYREMKVDVEVYKIGAKTGLTKGLLVSKDYNVSYPHPFDSSITIVIYKQYKVLWDDESGPFSKPGDSGAPVFMLDKDSGRIFLVGIVTGADPQRKLSCVIPICAILQALGDEYYVLPFKICLKKVKAFD